MADINHTFVDESLRGQGVAGRCSGPLRTRFGPGNRRSFTCSYAVTWFEKHPEEQDLVVKA